MASATSWKLPAEIIFLSQADNWEDAIKEWKRDGIEKLEPDEDSERCLCGHYPIRELCYIKNTKTLETAIVGNHCIEKFKEDGSTTDEFQSVPKIFQSLNRILKDINVSANDELVQQAKREKIFSEKEAIFYEDVKRKRNLSCKQYQYKQNLNQRLIDTIATSAKTSFKKLKADRTKSANPKLIKYAFHKKVLEKKDYDFYMKIWMMSYSTLTDKQKTYKIGLNNKIVYRLSEDFEDKSSASSSSSVPLKKRRIDTSKEED